MEGLTAERLAEIRARCEATKPAPWKVLPATDDDEAPSDYPEFFVLFTGAWDQGCRDTSLMDEAHAKFIAAARTDVPDLLVELDRLRYVRCAQPTATACAREWETDHQRRALEEFGLTDEFPFGCDAIQHVVEELVGARRELDRLRDLLAAERERCAARAESMQRRHDEACRPECKCADGFHVGAAIRKGT